MYEKTKINTKKVIVSFFLLSVTSNKSTLISSTNLPDTYFLSNPFAFFIKVLNFQNHLMTFEKP